MVRQRNRNQKGGAIAFGVVLAFVLVVLGSGFVLISMFMGGQKEVKNAVDAGTLNVGKQSLDNVTVDLDATPGQKCFDDVTTNDESPVNRDGKVSLRRINRVWGKAMMIAINAAAAQADGNAGSGPANADLAYNGAQEISDALSDKLNTEANMHQFFRDYAQSNSVRMIGNDLQIEAVPGAGWQTSLMERNKECNIALNGSPADNFHFPPGFSLPPDTYTQTTRNPVPASAGGKWFLKGYKPITVNGKQFWTVPFLYDERPHMVARSAFDAAKSSAVPLVWNKPVPNAYSSEGATKNVTMNAGEKATSWVLTNPRQTYTNSLPRSFMKIHVDEPKAHWFFYPTAWPPVETPGTEQSYGFTPTSLTGAPQLPGGIGCISVAPTPALIGTDTVGRSLDDLIFEYPITASQKQRLENIMVSRINQMISKPDHIQTSVQLHEILGRTATRLYLLAGVRDFYIYSPDGVNISIKSKIEAMAEASWLIPLIGNNPDGTENLEVDDEKSLPIYGSPPVPTPIPTFVPLAPTPLMFFTFGKDVGWQPGTGFNGCLGNVRVKRWTDLNEIAVCVFL